MLVFGAGISLAVGRFRFRMTGIERIANRRKGRNWDLLVGILHISRQEKSFTMSDSTKFRWSRSVQKSEKLLCRETDIV